MRRTKRRIKMMKRRPISRSMPTRSFNENCVRRTRNTILLEVVVSLLQKMSPNPRRMKILTKRRAARKSIPKEICSASRTSRTMSRLEK